VPNEFLMTKSDFAHHTNDLPGASSARRDFGTYTRVMAMHMRRQDDPSAYRFTHASAFWSEVSTSSSNRTTSLSGTWWKSR
jgi:hypothetical protein